MRWEVKPPRWSDGWSPYFALLPTMASVGPEGAAFGIVPDKEAKWVWLEWIERKPRAATDGPTSWYRLPQ